jgi:hypothetical protein
MNLHPRFLFAAGLLAASALVAQAKIERSVEKTFTVSGTGKIHLETQGGEIRVTPGADGVVKITAREKIRADTDAEADDILKKLELTFDQAGNDVTATSKYERQPIGIHFGFWPPVQVDFIVTVPASYATELNTSGGAISVGDLKGKVKAHTSGGSITLGHIGADVDAHTSGGNITVGRVDGQASLATSGGNIKIDSVVGALKAHTSGGSIRAAVAGPLKGDCVLDTSGGSVRVMVDKAAAFRLDASTSGGSVDASGLTITLEGSNRNRSRLAGNVNGGGPLLKLHTSGGSIEVKPM